MIIQLPLSADPAQSFTTQLGASKYAFEVRYNSRNGVWTFDMADSATGVAIVTGCPILLGVDFIDPYNLGIGAMVAQDLSGQNKDAGADDLGTRVVVYWVSANETFA